MEKQIIRIGHFLKFIHKTISDITKKKYNEMKLLDDIIEKFGVDKVLHFLGGGWLTSIFSPFGWVGIIIGIAVTIILSFIKELFLDSFFDWKDICAASIGSVISVLIYLFFAIFL